MSAKLLSEETETINELFSFFTTTEQSTYGANWRLRYREAPEKLKRVVADLRTEKQEGKTIRSYAAIANLRWKEFAPRTAR